MYKLFKESENAINYVIYTASDNEPHGSKTLRIDTLIFLLCSIVTVHIRTVCRFAYERCDSQC